MDVASPPAAWREAADDAAVANSDLQSEFGEPSASQTLAAATLSLRSLRPEVDVIKLAPWENGSLRVASLNLGGRNTNPIEFYLRGDKSEKAVEATAILQKAEKALKSGRDGPAALSSTERKLVEEILEAIYGQEPSAEWQERIFAWLRLETWSAVLADVEAKQPQLFNALNLRTLQLGRPSIWEDPASCSDFQSSEEYLAAWKSWYLGIDRTSRFWQEDASRTAKKRNIDVPTGFAGLLIFDVMCLCTARHGVRTSTSSSFAWTPRCEDRLRSLQTEVPFKHIAKFSSQLPASSLQARHSTVQRLIERTDSHVLLAQEVGEITEDPLIAGQFLPPFTALDGFTAVLLRHGAFLEATNISKAVAQKMEDLMDPEAREPGAAKAWRTSAHRLAAVVCQSSPDLGSFRVCFVSLHCSKSKYTAAFVETLREALAEYAADINIAGLDSNCSATEAAGFQRRLRKRGFEIGCHAKQDQVTVVKQRTSFQTQIQKAGETDVAHKDYIVSWGLRKARRGETLYTPDLRTVYGVDQATKRCMSLPNTRWPFDHCAVSTSFQPRQSCLRAALFTQRAALSCAVVFAVLFLFAMPAFSPRRSSPWGESGLWHPEQWRGTPRMGLCEASLHGDDQRCSGGWLKKEGSCYRVTPKEGFDEARTSCEAFGGHLVSIGSEAENQIATKLCPDGKFCWIGLLDADNRESSSWISSEPVTYTQMVEPGFAAFPVWPLSRDDEDEAWFISNKPGEIEGCHPEYMMAGEDLPGVVRFIFLAVPGLAAAISATVLLLPRPRQVLTDLYLFTAFTVNMSWYIMRISGSCFVSDPYVLQFLEFLDPHCTTGAHTVANLLAFWVILKRMSLLYPVRLQRLVFFVLIASVQLFAANLVLFTDTSTTVKATSAPVLFGWSLTGLIIFLYLLFAALFAKNLYQTWTFLAREATAGRSEEASKALNEGVAAARAHFLSVLAATASGVLHWCVVMVIFVGISETRFPVWAKFALTLTKLLDGATSDLCAYLLAALRMDDAVVWAKGITAEVAQRARTELEQHRLAVSVLKAAPTSQEQLRHLAELESATRCIEIQTEETFLVFQSVVRAETARIHQLMRCVRYRAMTSALRYQHLIDLPSLQAAPRQFVPAEHAQGGQSAAAAGDYLDWLYAEADGAQQMLFHRVEQLVGKFNSTPWPSELGLVQEEFPWAIWANGVDGAGKKHLQRAEVISPGDILIHSSTQCTCASALELRRPTHCIVLEESSNRVSIHCSGKELPDDVTRDELQTSHGGAVFIPGPKKKKQRCLDKIAADYDGKEPWPAAASLLDISRCMIVLDDPYAMAALVAYIQSTMQVVRLKNRFAEDVLDLVSPEELQAMFCTPDISEVSSLVSTADASSASSGSATDSQYRDISINVVVTNSNGVPFICEIQVTLSNLAILKQADQKLYTIRRMQSARELEATHVFSERPQGSTIGLVTSTRHF